MKRITTLSTAALIAFAPISAAAKSPFDDWKAPPPIKAIEWPYVIDGETGEKILMPPFLLELFELEQGQPINPEAAGQLRRALKKIGFKVLH